MSDPMSDITVEDILSRATENLRKLIEEAFEAGRAKERESTKRNVLSFFSHIAEPSEFTAALIHADRANTLAAATGSRAPSGTVKPAIKALIKNASDGIKAKKTGIKENSVRGTLSALKAEGFVERHGDLWVLSD
jgi:hypothetical protein